LFRAADAAYTDVENSGKGCPLNRRSECRSRRHSRPKRVPKLCGSSMMSSALRQFGSRNRSSGISAIRTSWCNTRTSPANAMLRGRLMLGLENECGW